LKEIIIAMSSKKGIFRGNKVQFSILLSRKIVDDMDDACGEKPFNSKNEAFEYLLRHCIDIENEPEDVEEKLREAYMAGFNFCADRVVSKYRSNAMKKCISIARKFIPGNFDDFMSKY
jgi:metal-responsive CopG/Arc/MetJ family transcriptional regulator